MAELFNCWCGDFDGTDTYVDAASPALLNYQPTLNAFSLQVWVRTTSGSNGDHVILAKAKTGAVQFMVSHNGSMLRVSIGGTTTSKTTSINDGSWHHVVVTVASGTGDRMLLYVDGVEVDGGTLKAIGSQTALVNILLGARRNADNTDSTERFLGNLDEVCMWGVELPEDAVISLYNGGAGVDAGQPVGDYLIDHVAALNAWWRLGDGTLENAGFVPTASVADMSGNGNTATIINETPATFYVAADLGTCIGSSSSAYVTGPSFQILREDQGNLREQTGFGGALHRLLLTCSAVGGADPNIFVLERGRVVVGTTLENYSFRRVATIRDLATVPVDVPTASPPYCFRTSQASLYAETNENFDALWNTVLDQAAALSADLVEFSPAGGSRSIISVQIFPSAPAPPAAESSSSSSSSLEASVYSSSSQSSSSSSSSSSVESSSSSTFVDPYAFSTYLLLEAPTGGDAATRQTTVEDVKTLFTDLGAVRFGRSNSGDTWDAFLRFACDIPQYALIESARLIMAAHTNEIGEDVVLRVTSIYANGSYDAISAFSGTSDPAVSHGGLVWDRVPSVETGSEYLPLDITSMLQFFVDRSQYTPGVDHFGIWIKELISDLGARRDATVTGSMIFVAVSYRTDRVMSSSSSA